MKKSSDEGSSFVSHRPGTGPNSPIPEAEKPGDRRDVHLFSLRGSSAKPGYVPSVPLFPMGGLRGIPGFEKRETWGTWLSLLPREEATNSSDDTPTRPRNYCIDEAVDYD
jgi:hypothetical protein